MLETLYISKSKIRRDLLALFFTNPYQKYYLRELERILGYSAGSIRRELLKFQKDDLFKTEKAGNMLYYQLNTKHPLYRELKSIVAKTVGLEARIRIALSSIISIRKLPPFLNIDIINEILIRKQPNLPTIRFIIQARAFLESSWKTSPYP